MLGVISHLSIALMMFFKIKTEKRLQLELKEKSQRVCHLTLVQFITRLTQTREPVEGGEVKDSNQDQKKRFSNLRI